MHDVVSVRQIGMATKCISKRDLRKPKFEKLEEEYIIIFLWLI
jgi:hypothetical protein